MGGNIMTALAQRQRDFQVAKIIINSTGEEKDMNVNDLRAMSMADLTKLYNEMAEKQVKRFESRQKAEERTAQLLRDAGKLEEGEAPAPAAKGKKGARKPVEAAPESVQETPAPGKQGKRTGKGKGEAPAPAPEAPKKGKKDAAPAPEKKRGAPTKNPTYTALGEKAKGYNPKGLRINPTSDRQKVLDFIRTKPDGVTREQVEKKFTGEKVNVASALYFLAQCSFVKVAD